MTSATDPLRGPSRSAPIAVAIACAAVSLVAAPPAAAQPAPPSSPPPPVGSTPSVDSGATRELSSDPDAKSAGRADGAAKPTLRIDSSSLAPDAFRAEAVDYSGRTPGRTAGDVLIWIPRVVFFPLYLVTEYVIRVPLQAFTVFVEQHKLVETLKDVFIFGPDNNIGVVPTGLIDFGFRPSIGVYFFYDDFLAKNNGLRVHLATGGPDYLRSTVTDRIGLDKTSFVKLRFEGVTRPDYVFYGLGPRSLEVNRSRYRETSFEGTIGFSGEPRPGNVFEGYMTVKNARFAENGYYSDDPSLVTQIVTQKLQAPPGIEDGYTALRQGIWFSLDSRNPRPAPGSGVRLEGKLEHDFNLEDPLPGRWLRWGGTFGGFLDLTGHNRVLSLSVSTDFADPLGDAPVPFTELATLGGDFAPMHGYLAGRLYDRSAIAATLEYRWPIWSFLDGDAQVAVGNVFGAHFSGFEPDLLRFSWNAGIRSAGARDHSFNIMLGSGTETFKDGGHLDSLRFEFGAIRGF